MENLRKYGKAPFSLAVIHGGPGASGEMAPVARELASDWGVLEPLQTESSLTGQIEELKTVLERNGELPVTLIGFSWGAWLSFIFAANHPTFVEKLILIGSGPYEADYAKGIQETRFNRLNEGDKTELKYIIEILNNPTVEEKQTEFARLGALISKADAYDPVVYKSEVIDWRVDIFKSVWSDAAEMRRRGKLLEFGKHIKCPVVAIHGDFDPHPAEGVRKPLSAILKSFRFILLEKCGHMPWIEKQARERFYNILRIELQ